MGLPPKLEGLPDDTIRLADLREMLEDVEFERAEPEPTVRRGLKSPSVRNGNAPEPRPDGAPHKGKVRLTWWVTAMTTSHFSPPEKSRPFSHCHSIASTNCRSTACGSDAAAKQKRKSVRKLASNGQMW